MYNIEVKLENIGPDDEILIDGVGALKNNTTTEISKEVAEQYRLSNAKSEFDNKGNTKLILGPTLLAAFKNVTGITVTKQLVDGDKEPVVADDSVVDTNDGGSN